MAFSFSSIHLKLTSPTKFLGFQLWSLIVFSIVITLLLILIFTCIYIWCKRGEIYEEDSSNPKASKNLYRGYSMDRRLLSRKEMDLEMSIRTPEKEVMYSDQLFSNEKNCDLNYHVINMEHLVGTSKFYTMREIEAATNGLGEQTVIGSGNHGVVFRGVLDGNTRVAIKKLFGYRINVGCFVKQAEVMWLIRHKNLVKMLGYCAEGPYRMLVYEHIENGNLKKWLHPSGYDESPLTWNIRMKIIIGIAKGLNYLHEDTEPAVVHQNLKSTNILLDEQWNPKISDFGITNFLGPEYNHAVAPPTGMLGYIAPEYSSTRFLDEKSDIYSFGVLIMEIISGKTSMESTVNEIEEYLVDWIKTMVEYEKYDLLVDPRLPEYPTVKGLKRIVLIALRCVDFEVEKRPKMSEIIHMLEPCDLLLSDDTVIKIQVSRRNSLKKNRK